MPSVFLGHDISDDKKQELLSSSKSQIKQDIFVYLNSRKKRNGFFVEFGACDGIALSNSYMLEEKFSWTGILVEPSVFWFNKLKGNRPLSHIENAGVWSKTGEALVFNQTEESYLSTIDQYTNRDSLSDRRQKGIKYEVRTISLFDLLRKYNAPQTIDYLSIDTEGSEFDILAAFFKQNNNFYSINIVTCEHNYTADRERIYALMVANGYERVGTDFSAHDDFYILKQ